MRAFATLLAVALVVGCASKDAEIPAGPTLADFAGNWQVTSMLTGTPTPVTSTLSGTADSTSWTMSLEGRPNVPIQVSVVGDSLIAQSAEYESVLRAGVMVSVRTAGAMTGGELSGTVTATYKAETGDEVVNGTITATKVM